MKKKLPEDVKEFFRREGAKGGKKGGKARMAQLTPEQRITLAKKAAAARWGKKKAASAKVRSAKAKAKRKEEK